MDNPIIKIIENQENARKEQAKLQSEWGIYQRNKLVKVLEGAGAIITNNMWDMLLFKINGLRISENGKVCYLSFDKPSKKILELFGRYNRVIIDNFKHITSRV